LIRRYLKILEQFSQFHFPSPHTDVRPWQRSALRNVMNVVRLWIKQNAGRTCTYDIFNDCLTLRDLKGCNRSQEDRKAGVKRVIVVR
jgi:hypothetical protein